MLFRSNVAVARRLVEPQAGDDFDLAALELDALGLSDVMHRRPAALAPAEQRLVLIADDAEGVNVGLDMTFAGFPIGRVTRVELGADGVVRIDDTRLCCRSGATIPVALVLNPIRDHGEVLGAVMVFRDMTQMVAARVELEAARAAAEAASRAKIGRAHV